ncbi:1046_t:CDS:2 [Funneliformis geosporum]|uniref:1046_t:CDS:1 n=1 Tax=Funneliformis geosporum TaxID=1117311 RepID=A0A9W4X239_9GLOM|nr:1046_t:CDS:2 [Funneliformis geosporum]
MTLSKSCVDGPHLIGDLTELQGLTSPRGRTQQRAKSLVKKLPWQLTEDAEPTLGRTHPSRGARRRRRNKYSVFHAFYKDLNDMSNDSSSPEEVNNKVKKLLKTKKLETKKVGRMWIENEGQHNVLKDATNVRKSDGELSEDDSTLRSNRQPDNLAEQELPHSISRSEVYKSVNFQPVTIKYFLRTANKLTQIPESVRTYLEKKPKPENKSAESDVQAWFNGLMEVSSLTWEGVSAVDTHKISYLGGLMPGISVFDNDDIEDGALVAKYSHTVLEIKRQKFQSGLSDEDKGQLLDYVRILVQQQPLRRYFAAYENLSGIPNNFRERAVFIFDDDFSKITSHIDF